MFVLFTLLFALSWSPGRGQLRVDCSWAVTDAQGVANNNCGCKAPPVCLPCSRVIDTYGATCLNGCEYCDQSLSTCVIVDKLAIWGSYDLDVFGVIIPQLTSYEKYEYSYTKGGNGSVIYWNDNGDTCGVTVNGKKCASCTLRQCGGSTNFAEPTINCTNLEAGATATACSGNSAGGPVSLDESALNGILAPLAFPNLLCQRKATVLGTGPVPLPSAPTTSPPPGAPPNSSCGLFKLNIFCLTGCGLLRRILGFCKRG
jgi:hypothetical protein